MKITNRFNLPDAFYNFARNDKYSRGKADISVTTLIDSPRVRLMRDKYNDQLETDASDMIWLCSAPPFTMCWRVPTIPVM
jgi:hypothetical protein